MFSTSLLLLFGVALLTIFFYKLKQNLRHTRDTSFYICLNINESMNHSTYSETNESQSPVVIAIFLPRTSILFVEISSKIVW